MDKEDHLYYIAAKYFATGEGNTVMTLITRAYPCKDDYVEESYVSEDGKWHFNDDTKNTGEERALREFIDEFDGYFAQGAEILSREEFFHRYSKYVPEIVYKITDPETGQPSGFVWKGMLYLNFS